MLYRKGIKAHFGKFYIATWRPGKLVALGDIVTFRSDGTFDHQSSLNKLGVDFEVRLDKTESQESGSSKKGVTTRVKLAGEASFPGSALKDPEAGIVIELNGKGSFVFQFDDVKYHTITHLDPVNRAIESLFKRGVWQRDWCLITEVVDVGSATIAVSKSSGGKLEIRAKAGIGSKVTDVDIADASLGLEFAGERNLEEKIVGDEATPVFRAIRMKNRLPRAMAVDTAGQNESFEMEDFELDVDNLS